MQTAMIVEKPRKRAISGRFWAGRTYRGRIKDDHKIDPACGTAGFLVSAAQYIREHYEDTMTQEQWEAFAGKTFSGFDMDRTMLRMLGL